MTAALSAERVADYHYLDVEVYRDEMVADMVVFLQHVVDIRPDVLMYLDKSARPISWAVRQAMKDRYPGKIPETKYLHYGRNMNITKNPPAAEVERLRAAFSSKNGKSHLAGKDILVVDEFSFSGKTLKGAINLIESTFPEVGSVSGVDVLERTPPWYNEAGLIGVTNIGTFISGAYSRYPRRQRRLRHDMKNLGDEIMGLKPYLWSAISNGS